jgi:hypothetical protein
MQFSLLKKAVPLLCFGILGCLTPKRARAEEIPNTYDSNLSQALYSEGQTNIPGLIWSGENNQPDFTIEPQKNGKPAARVHGKFESKNAGTLLFSSEVLQRAQFSDDAGNFTVLIPLNGRKTPVKVQYIDDYGNKQSQDIEIVYENFYQFQLTQQTKKRWNFDGGASLSYLDYKQTADTTNVHITQLGLTPKIGVTYNLSEKLDIGASGFGTLIGLPFTKTPDGLSTPRFYGLNMRIGYKILGLKTGNIYLMTGAYFWGMIVPPSPNGLAYGVVKLSGPQLFLVGRFLTSGGRTLVGYLKGATITNGEGGSSSNHEFAIGGAFQITAPKAKRRFMMNIDYAAASFLVAGERIQLNSLSMGLSTPLF